MTSAALRTNWPLAILLLVGALLTACSPSPAGGDLPSPYADAPTPVLPPRLDFTVRPAGGTSIGAIGRVEAPDLAPTTTVEMTLAARLTAGLRLLVYLRDGKCDALGTIVGLIGEVSAGPEGQGLLVASRIEAGGGPQPLTWELLGDGARVVTMHDTTGVLVACGETPSSASR